MIKSSNINITPEMLKIIAEIDNFKGAWLRNAESIGHIALEKLKKISTIESIGSSNRIEGNSLSDIEIMTVLANVGVQSFRNRDEEEVLGYSEVLNTVYENFSEIPFTEGYIKQLHKIMLKHTAKDAHHCGEYKKISNTIAAFDANGKEIGIVFQTATPFDTPQLMADLVKWTQDAFEDGILHPLLVIGVFVVHFLAIHPFQDGNGRLSRILTMLCLLKTGYSYVVYSSVESIIEANKSSYYMALRNTQKTINAGNANYEPWLNFFLTALLKQTKHLQEKIDSLETDKKLTKNAESVLKLFDKQSEWTASEISDKTGLNPETTRKILQTLCRRRYIVKFGTTKGSFYRKMNSCCKL